MVTRKVTGWPALAVVAVAWPVTVLGAGETVWVATGEVLGARLEAPTKVAVMALVPTGRVDTGSVALPRASRGASPIGVGPSKKRTVPIGAGPAAEATCAFRTRACPKTDAGPGAIASEVVVGVTATSTSTASAADDPVKFRGATA